MAATATALARGNVLASARSTPGITIRDPPAPRPQDLQYVAPIETAMATIF